MRLSLTVLALLVGQLLASGCSYYVVHELREDEDVPLHVGSTRKAIEAKLGQPKLSEAWDSCQISIYGYVPPEIWHREEFRGASEASAMIYGLAEPFAFIYGLLEPSDRLGVVYDPSGEMLRYVVYREDTTEEALDKMASIDGLSEDCNMLSEKAIEPWAKECRPKNISCLTGNRREIQRCGCTMTKQ